MEVIKQFLKVIYLFNQIGLLECFLASNKEVIQQFVVSCQEEVYLLSQYCLLDLRLASIKEVIQLLSGGNLLI